MRGLRLLLLLVAAIALGWYAYNDSKKGPVDDSPKRDKVFTVDADKIDEIAIRPESGERTTLRRKGSDWEVVEPVTAAADQAAVSGLTTNLASLEVQRVVDDSPADLKEFGLAAPRVEVGFKAGGEQHRILLGQKTPSGTDIYAKRPESPRVFLISSYLDGTFNRTTFDLRDKSVLKLDQTKVDALDIDAGGRTTRFEKKNGEWQITQPFDARADFSAVDGLVSRVGSVQMKSIMPDATDLKKYGLDKPAVSVGLGSGSARATLAIGGTAEAGSVYARDLSRPAVFTIDAALADDLKKGAADYRQKDLFDARSFNATRLEIERNGQTRVFEKSSTKNKDGQEQQVWRQTAPAAHDVDAAKLESLISAATSARATGFTDNAARAGLDKPELTVAFTYDGGKQEQVRFARAGESAYAARAGSPGAATIDPKTIDAIVKALEDVK